MSIANEIIMMVTAASFGFTIATGINFTYFENITTETKNHSSNEFTARIPDFWNKYADIRRVTDNVVKKTHKHVLCVVIDADEICVPKIE